MKGDPPTEYSIPMGWAKFPLKRHPSANDKIDTWQVAFYGTRPGEFICTLNCNTNNSYNNFSKEINYFMYILRIN